MNTKKQPQKTRNLPILLVAIILIAALGAGVGYHHYKDTKKISTDTSSSSKINYSAAPSADSNASNARKGSPDSSAPLGSTGTSTTPSTSSTTPTFSVQIVNSTVNDGNVHVGTLVSGITTGSCTLSASMAGQSSVQLGTSSVTQDVNNYDCGVFNIPTKTFPANGNWVLSLSVTSAGNTESGDANVTVSSNE